MIQRQPRPKVKQDTSIGKLVGKGVDLLLSKGIGGLITGFGDYKVASNTLLTGGLDPPTIVNSVREGGVIIRHREYLRDINASTNFSIDSFPLNPGIIETFPWLSNVALHFEQYKFRGVIFEFKSLSSDAVLSAATSSALGSVIMATQYNALSPQFNDKFNMENYEFANSAKPSQSFLHPIECMRTQTPVYELFVRGTGTPADADLRLYDMGTFNIATVGMQGSGGIAGELWVTYEIELLKPKLQNPTNSDELVDHWLLKSTATNANPFTGATIQSGSTLEGTLENNYYLWPEFVTDGLYLCVWQLSGVATVLGGTTKTLFNCTSAPVWQVTTAGTASVYSDFYTVNVTGPSATITYSGGTYPASPTGGNFMVIELPGNLTQVINRVQRLEREIVGSSQNVDELVELFRTLLSRRERDSAMSNLSSTLNSLI